MVPLRVEPATTDDIPRLLEIRSAAFTEHAPSAYSPDEVETLLGDVDASELAQMVDEGQLFNLPSHAVARHLFVAVGEVKAFGIEYVVMVKRL